MEWLSIWTAWHWLILGFALLIAEIVISGVFLLWWGLAAIVIAGVMALFPTFSLISLAIAYAILATILSLAWWKYQHRKDQADEQHSSLNQRDHAMLGARGKVQEIAESGIGRGAFGDTTWRIQSSEVLNVGEVIEVVAVQGITLRVKKVN